MTKQPDASPRVFDGDTLVVATHNPGKLREFHELFAPRGITVKSAADLDLPEPEETEKTFSGNAVLKARAAATASGHVCLADDSGFAVNALNGAPGVYSARWAENPANVEKGRDFNYAMHKVHNEMKDKDDHSAGFVCVLALAWPDGHTEVVQGDVTGQVVWPPRGENGFGYDPMFMPDGETRTFGEMTSGEKQALSHRRRALDALLATCFK